MLLYKKMDPMEGFAVGEPINVTISVFNKGQRDAAQSNQATRRAMARLDPPMPPALCVCAQALATRTAWS